MDYSISDYHHNPSPQTVVRQSSTQPSFGATQAERRQSQYSLLDPDMPPPARNPTRESQRQSVHRRRHSIAETESSYDPFNPSRAPITKTQADHARITVLRGVSQGSSRKPSTRLGSRVSLRHPGIARAQEADELYSIASSPPNMTMHSAGTSQLQKLMVNRHISRGSSRLTMASKRSRASNSSGIVARTSASYKRNLSFVGNRKRPYNGRHPRLRSQEHRTSLTLQQRYARDQAKAQALSRTQAQDQSQIESTETTHSSSVSLRETPEPEELLIVRSRKTTTDSNDPVAKRVRTSSHYFRDDARQVSTEMEKLCDEAFNRSSMTSSNPTPRTTFTADSRQTYKDYHSPATSISMHDDPVPIPYLNHSKTKEVMDYQHRPLPKPPATERTMNTEHLGSYTQRELAKTRDLLKKRAAESSIGPGYLDDIIAHLDRLMQPSAVRISEQERRAISTPNTESGIPRKDTFDEIMAKNNIGYRSASEPYKRQKSGLREETIRVVDRSDGLKPISPIKPLSIRKKSESSTPSSGSPRRPTPTQQLFTTEDLYRQREEQRSAGLALLDHQELEPIEEDEDKENFDPADRSRGYPGQPKKRNWFRRHQAQRSRDNDKPLPPLIKDHRPLGENCDPQIQKRKSGAPSEDSQTSEPTKATGKGRFFKIFATKRDSKDSQKSGDYDLDDGESIDTAGSSRNYNPQQAYMSGALRNASQTSVFKRSKQASRDDKLMPPPPVPRTIQPQHQNWLARFLRIKPAVSVLCFQVSKVRARKEVASVFRDWRKFGMRDIVVDKTAGRVWARVDVKNCKSRSSLSLSGYPFRLLILILTCLLSSPPDPLPLSRRRVPHPPPPRSPRQSRYCSLHAGEGRKI